MEKAMRRSYGPDSRKHIFAIINIFIILIVSFSSFIVIADPPGSPPTGVYRGTVASLDKEGFAGSPVSVAVAVSVPLPSGKTTPTVQVSFSITDKAYAYAIAAIGYARSYDTGEIVEFAYSHITDTQSDFGYLCNHIVYVAQKPGGINIVETYSYTKITAYKAIIGAYTKYGACGFTFLPFTINATAIYVAFKNTA